MRQVLEILQTGTKAKPTSASFNSQLTPEKVSLPAVFYGCLLTAIVMEMIPKSPLVSPRRGDCCRSGLCCTAESKHGWLLLFYFIYQQKGCAWPFLRAAPSPAVALVGRELRGVPPVPLPCLTTHGLGAGGGICNLAGSRFCVRQVPFTISIQIKCAFPCNIQQAAFPGFLTVLHRVV